jgi:DNA-binding XRE family transcriptional regulator
MTNKEIVTSFPMKCEGASVGEEDPPLRNKPTPITVTVYQEDGDIEREIGCAYLSKGRCSAAGGSACIHLSPESSRSSGAVRKKISSPQGDSVTIDGAKLRELRRRNRLTQQQLADAAKSGHTLLWKLERVGKPANTKTERAERIAERLGVPLHEILYDPNSAEPESSSGARRGARRRRRPAS